MEARQTVEQPIHIRSACKAVLTLLDGALRQKAIATWNPRECPLSRRLHDERLFKSMNVRVGTKGRYIGTKGCYIMVLRLTPETTLGGMKHRSTSFGADSRRLDRPEFAS